jgi:hypothetical protein
MTEDQREEEKMHGVNGQRRQGLEGWAEELQRHKQTYPPPKLDDEEYVIEVKAGYILGECCEHCATCLLRTCVTA